MTRRSHKKRIIIISAIVVVILLFIFYQRYQSAKNSKPVYEKVTIVRGDIQVNVLTTGSVQPENRISIKPPISGRIEHLLVDEGSHVTKGTTLLYMSSIERAALIDAASAEGAAAVEEWARLYREVPIVAPVDGTIIKRYMQAGQSFLQGEAIFDLADRLTVNAQVDETDIAQIKVNETATVTLDAYPDAPFKGHVLKIAYDSTTANNVTTYVVVVVPDKIPDFVRSGMTANITFEVQAKTGVLLVPANVLKFHDGKTFVLIPPKGDDEAPIEREITTGLSNGKELEVLSGLKENDVVLTTEFKLKDAADNANPFSPFGSRAKGKPKS